MWMATSSMQQSRNWNTINLLILLNCGVLLFPISPPKFNLAGWRDLIGSAGWRYLIVIFGKVWPEFGKNTIIYIEYLFYCDFRTSLKGVILNRFTEFLTLFICCSRHIKISFYPLSALGVFLLWLKLFGIYQNKILTLVKWDWERKSYINCYCDFLLPNST